MITMISHFIYQTFCDSNKEFEPNEFGKFVGCLTKGGPDAVNAIKTTLIPRAMKQFNTGEHKQRNKVIQDVALGVLSGNPRLLEGLK